MTQPLVSVITIVFNGETYLEQTIQSVLNQTYPNIEYIIIDGGSTDNSIAIIEKYSHRLAYWISEKDKGVSDAFNKGLRQVKGEIIGIINADDWYEPEAVEKVVQHMGNAHVSYGDLQYWKNGVKEMIVEGNEDLLIHEMSVNHPTVFVRAECYRDVGLFSTDLKYAMDYDLMVRLQQKGYKFIRIQGVLANMRWEGLSDQQWYKACQELRSIKDKYFPNKILLNQLYFHKQVASIKLGKFLHRLRMHQGVRFYRRWLSPIRKKYD